MSLLTIDNAGDGYLATANHMKQKIWKKALMGGKLVTSDEGDNWKQTDIGWFPCWGYWNEEPDEEIKKEFGLSGGEHFAHEGRIGGWSEAVPATYSSKYGLYPRYNEDKCDSRFKALDYGSDDFYVLNGRHLAGGQSGIMLEGTIDTEYKPLFAPIYELTCDHESGDGRYSTPVYAIAGNALDRDRNATFNIFWVKENDKKTYQLAWNHRQAINEDTGWGFYVSLGIGGKAKLKNVIISSGTGGMWTVGHTGSRVDKTNIPNKDQKSTLAYGSWVRNGPWHPGHAIPGVDKHFLGKNADDESINSGHIDTEAYFFWNELFDAPLNFQKRTMPGRGHFPYMSYVHLVYDPSLTHDHETGTKPGRWDLYCEVPMYTPHPPPYSPPDEPGIPIPVNTDKIWIDNDLINELYKREKEGIKEYHLGKPREQGTENATGSTGQHGRASRGFRFGGKTISIVPKFGYRKPGYEYTKKGAIITSSSGEEHFWEDNNPDPYGKKLGGKETTKKQAGKGTTKKQAEENRLKRQKGRGPAQKRMEEILKGDVQSLSPMVWSQTNLAKCTSYKWDYTHIPSQSWFQDGTVSGTAYYTPPEFLGDSRIVPTGTPAVDNYSQLYFGWHPSIGLGW
ncbi:MAG: hypothetical protein KKH44_10560, partial [Bacteroidetes bacterium]|nr:hypothetical protein [Bacteroidota bacterium]